jgi:hypothetical protein
LWIAFCDVIIVLILSSSCLARCALSTSTVRGPMWILRSLLVLVVETHVFVRVSAERLTVMEGLPVRSTAGPPLAFPQRFLRALKPLPETHRTSWALAHA